MFVNLLHSLLQCKPLLGFGGRCAPIRHDSLAGVFPAGDRGSAAIAVQPAVLRISPPQAGTHRVYPVGSRLPPRDAHLLKPTARASVAGSMSHSRVNHSVVPYFPRPALNRALPVCRRERILPPLGSDPKFADWPGWGRYLIPANLQDRVPSNALRWEPLGRRFQLPESDSSPTLLALHQ